MKTLSDKDISILNDIIKNRGGCDTIDCSYCPVARIYGRDKCKNDSNSFELAKSLEKEIVAIKLKNFLEIL